MFIVSIMEKLLSILFIITILMKLGDSKICKETLRVVSRCPANTVEYEEKSKKCNSACSTSNTFQYHCLRSANKLELIEVCAVPQFLFGFCPEYDPKGEVIQIDQSNSTACNSSSSETYYISSNIFYCGAHCLELSKKQHGNNIIDTPDFSINSTKTPDNSNDVTLAITETPDNSISTTKTHDNSNDVTLAIALWVIVTVIVIVVVRLLIYVCVCKLREKRGQEIDKGDHPYEDNPFLSREKQDYIPTFSITQKIREGRCSSDQQSRVPSVFEIGKAGLKKISV